MLIVLLSLLIVAIYKKSGLIFCGCDVNAGVVHENEEQNHSKEMAPYIHWLVVQLHYRFDDRTAGVIVVDTVPTKNIFIVYEMLRCLFNSSNEGFHGLLRILNWFLQCFLHSPLLLLLWLLLICWLVTLIKRFRWWTILMGGFWMLRRAWWFNLLH